MKQFLLATRRAAASYQRSEGDKRSAEITLNGEAVGRLTAPTVSRLIAENLRRQRFVP